jgi:hypothetical protein
MAEKKTKIKLQGTNVEVDGTIVEVTESTERWSEFNLEDGTILRVKMTVISAVRVDGQYDPEGNPQYILNMTPVMGIKSVPDELRKKVQ